MMREHGQHWPAEWLRSRGLGEWAEYWKKLSGHNDQKQQVKTAASIYANGAEASANGEVG